MCKCVGRVASSNFTWSKNKGKTDSQEREIKYVGGNFIFLSQFILKSLEVRFELDCLDKKLCCETIEFS